MRSKTYMFHHPIHIFFLKDRERKNRPISLLVYSITAEAYEIYCVSTFFASKKVAFSLSFLLRKNIAHPHSNFAPAIIYQIKK